MALVVQNSTITNDNINNKEQQLTADTIVADTIVDIITNTTNSSINYANTNLKVERLGNKRKLNFTNVVNKQQKLNLPPDSDILYEQQSKTLRDKLGLNENFIAENKKTSNFNRNYAFRLKDLLSDIKLDAARQLMINEIFKVLNTTETGKIDFSDVSDAKLELYQTLVQRLRHQDQASNPLVHAQETNNVAVFQKMDMLTYFTIYMYINDQNIGNDCIKFVEDNKEKARFFMGKHPTMIRPLLSLCLRSEYVKHADSFDKEVESDFSAFYAPVVTLLISALNGKINIRNIWNFGFTEFLFSNSNMNAINVNPFTYIPVMGDKEINFEKIPDVSAETIKNYAGYLLHHMSSFLTQKLEVVRNSYTPGSYYTETEGVFFRDILNQHNQFIRDAEHDTYGNIVDYALSLITTSVLPQQRKQQLVNEFQNAITYLTDNNREFLRTNLNQKILDIQEISSMDILRDYALTPNNANRMVRLQLETMKKFFDVLTQLPSTLTGQQQNVIKREFVTNFIPHYQTLTKAITTSERAKGIDRSIAENFIEDAVEVFKEVSKNSVLYSLRSENSYIQNIPFKYESSSTLSHEVNFNWAGGNTYIETLHTTRFRRYTFNLCWKYAQHVLRKAVFDEDEPNTVRRIEDIQKDIEERLLTLDSISVMVNYLFVFLWFYSKQVNYKYFPAIVMGVGMMSTYAVDYMQRTTAYLTSLYAETAYKITDFVAKTATRVANSQEKYVFLQGGQKLIFSVPKKAVIAMVGSVMMLEVIKDFFDLSFVNDILQSFIEFDEKLISSYINAGKDIFSVFKGEKPDRPTDADKMKFKSRMIAYKKESLSKNRIQASTVNKDAAPMDQINDVLYMFSHLAINVTASSVAYANSDLRGLIESGMLLKFSDKQQILGKELYVAQLHVLCDVLRKPINYKELWDEHMDSLDEKEKTKLQDMKNVFMTQNENCPDLGDTKDIYGFTYCQLQFLTEEQKKLMEDALIISVINMLESQKKKMKRTKAHTALSYKLLEEPTNLKRLSLLLSDQAKELLRMDK